MTETTNLQVASEANAPALNDLEAQITFFQANSYVVLPGLLPPDLIASLNTAIDQDRQDKGYLRPKWNA